MNVLDLFSGIGGFSLGLGRAGMKTVAFCEIEKYPQAVLKKNFPGVPIYEDVRKLTAERLRADGIDTIDLVCGGFPCQPFSVAGKQRGKEDDRFLWPEMLRIVQELQPTWVIGENVAGFVSMALDEVCAGLENAGYEVQPLIIPACAVNAPHRRDRVWIVAHSDSARGWRSYRNIIDENRRTGKKGRACISHNTEGREGFAIRDSGTTSEIFSDTSRQLRDGSGSARNGRPEPANCCENVADTESGELWNVCENVRPECEEIDAPYNAGRSFAGDDRKGRQTYGSTNGTGCEKQHLAAIADRPGQCAGELVATGPDWTTESPFRGVANGIPRRVDRLKALGNAVVPQIPEIIGRAIMNIEGFNSCNV